MTTKAAEVWPDSKIAKFRAKIRLNLPVYLSARLQDIISQKRNLLAFALLLMFLMRRQLITIIRDKFVPAYILTNKGREIAVPKSFKPANNF